MIHRYKQNGYNIVLDICSNSIHAVDDVTYDVIGLYGENTTEQIIEELLCKYGNKTNEGDIMESIAEVEETKASGKLFAPDIYGDRAFELKAKNRNLKAVCLHVSHTCNLNCQYCFARQGKFSGEDALMSFEVGKQALDFLIANSGSRRNLEVDFFGGEPLMNFQVVKDLVAYGREQEKLHNKNFRFTLTTNGLLVDDEIIEFANREMENVVLSLDGRREVHDHLRKTVNGVGSYDIIVPKFKEFVKRRGHKGYYMRGTFTHNNTDFTKDILHMAELGFDSLSMEPVVCDKEDPYALTESDFPKLCREYEILAEEMLRRQKEGNPFKFYHYTIDLTGGPCIYKRISGCGSGTEYMAVTPWGELYPCHQFVGDEDYKLGDIWQGVQRQDIVEEFQNCNTYSRKECAECWARLYCSGGCAANSYHATGNIKGVYEYGCRLFKKRLECAIMMKVAQSLEE